MTEDEREVLRSTRHKVESASRLVEASVERTSSYNPQKDYTPEELEPYDALSDRFMRAVETCIRFFRSYERFVQGVQSDTFRDTLHVVRKTDLISDVEIWMDMRDVRNRIVHDYSPEQRARLYAEIRGRFFDELQHVVRRIDQLQPFAS